MRKKKRKNTVNPKKLVELYKPSKQSSEALVDAPFILNLLN